MDFTRQDQLNCDNLIKALKKGQFTLDGLEAIAFADAYKWLATLQAVIAVSIEKQKNQAAIEVKKVQEPITEPSPVATSAPKGSRKKT